MDFRRRAFATENFPWGSIKEQKQRLAIVGTSTRDHVRSVFAQPRHHLGVWAGILVAVIVVLGDSISTLALASTYGFSEANHTAALLQSALGLPGYVIAATIVSFALASLILVRGSNLIAWVLMASGLTFILFKGYVAYTNLALVLPLF